MFKIQKDSFYNSSFYIAGPNDGDCFISINTHDSDDLTAETLKRYAEKMVSILNDHWEDRKYTKSIEHNEFKDWLITKFSELSKERENNETISNIIIESKESEKTEESGTFIKFDIVKKREFILAR